ncbi:MAG: SIMPL domain-containing protein, partial [Patescibacteria group bacterium]
MNDHDSRKQLVIYGEGKVSAEPDVTDVYCSVQAENPLITTAVRLQSEKMQALLARLSTFKIPSKDIITLEYGWNERNDYNQETREHVFKGWAVTQRLRIRAPLPPSSLIIQRIADLVKVERVNLVVKDADNLRELASQLAIFDAQQK